MRRIPVVKFALVVCLIATAVRAEEEESLADDPGGRARARALIEGPRSTGQQQHILEEAAREAAKWKIGGFRTTSAISGVAWVNVGPASGMQVSPLAQLAADTGRVRKIVPHPTDPNVLYVATAGG